MQHIYPWLADAWQSWKQRLNEQSFASATLISAPAGLGTFQMAELFARALMCQTHSSEPCGFCHGCDLMQSGSHPDYHLVRPEKEGRTISVDQIRQCNRLAQESSQLSGYRLIVIEPAEAMNESAANALLKTLEEPAEKCVFVLLTSRINHLLPTIVSRCQQITVAEPSASLVAEWLAGELQQDVPAFASNIHGNAPLLTREFIASGGMKQYQELEAKFIQAIQGDILSQLECAKLAASEPQSRLNWLWYLMTDAQKAHFSLAQNHMTPGCLAVAKACSFALLQQQTEALAKLSEQLRVFSGLNGELMITDWLLKFNEEACL
ncbi:DNA polymerase III subunit delta' [Vibrio fluvialis]|uniref:DNA polymerase III subunit delta' n=1 Tax=Vibrio fluvialis PG41 TaxID=1336752 RepID=S7I333_VIBFL|nr:DNA polymerase III subunit delta' [Vibrio fluvialis]EPP22483.1 DNA polymerase III delta prime subunit [Vibrio fluvialis PG41]MBY8105661.1 DNA polymerase III subunit delta' [Vibrio fluvialis]WIE02327.1 DNA polymerase III subunit delta' [Vibrio fluvialis]